MDRTRSILRMELRRGLGPGRHGSWCTRARASSTRSPASCMPPHRLLRCCSGAPGRNRRCGRTVLGGVQALPASTRAGATVGGRRTPRRRHRSRSRRPACRPTRRRTLAGTPRPDRTPTRLRRGHTDAVSRATRCRRAGRAREKRPTTTLPSAAGRRLASVEAFVGLFRVPRHWSPSILIRVDIAVETGR